MNSFLNILLFSVLFISRLLFISGQTNTGNTPDPTLPVGTCFAGCSNENTAWISSWSAAENTFIANPTAEAAEKFYSAICADPSYVNLIKCFANSCANTVWTADLTEAWKSFEADCKANGHAVANGISTLPPPSAVGSTGTNNPIPNSPSTSTGSNIEQCSTQCDALSKQVSSELEGITNNNFGQLCTSSLPNFYKCLITYCATDGNTAQAFNNVYNGLASVCRSHGYSVAGSNQGSSAGYSTAHFSMKIIIAIGFLSLLAIKFA
jgi:hypothetical protein